MSDDSCQHPESLLYILANGPNPQNDIYWCRGCGSLKGWRPRDQAAVSTDEWQPPDGAIPVWAARKSASGFVPWPADQPPKYNGIGEPCDMWTGPCCCGATHREGR